MRQTPGAITILAEWPPGTGSELPRLMEIQDDEGNPARKAVLAAMARMLAGTPTIVRPGRLSKAGLAREA